MAGSDAKLKAKCVECGLVKSCHSKVHLFLLFLSCYVLFKKMVPEFFLKQSFFKLQKVKNPSIKVYVHYFSNLS